VSDISNTLASELAALRELIADHERRLFPVNRRGLPLPTGRVDQRYVGMVGDCWEVEADTRRARGWLVLVLDACEEDSDHVYVHTPQGMYSEPDAVGGDVVSLRPEKARLLAASILAAVDRLEQRTRVVVPLRAGEAEGA